MSETLWGSLLFGVSLFIIGGIMLVSAVREFFQGRDRMKKWRLAEGTVIGQESSDDGDDFPLIEFRDHNGHIQTFGSHWKTVINPAAGSRVQVLYDPQNPDNAIHHTVFSTYVMPLMLVGFGIVVISAALYYVMGGE